MLSPKSTWSLQSETFGAGPRRETELSGRCSFGDTFLWNPAYLQYSRMTSQVTQNLLVWVRCSNDLVILMPMSASLISTGSPFRSPFQPGHQFRNTSKNGKAELASKSKTSTVPAVLTVPTVPTVPTSINHLRHISLIGLFTEQIS